MVNKSAAPGCDTGYKRAKKNEDPGPSEEEHGSCYHFPSNEERMKIWESKVPREGFKAKKLYARNISLLMISKWRVLIQNFSVM